MIYKIVFLCIALCSFIALQGQEIKVMTYNIKYDNVTDTVNNWNDRKEKLVDLIEHYNPSFIGAQEALHHQVAYVDSSLTGYAYIGVGREDGKQKGEYAEIHYDSTRYKILEHDTFWLSDTPDVPSIGWDAALERICTYGLFENLETRKKLWVFNTHFDHKGDEARNNSAQLIVEKIKTINSDNLPVVLTGDFNLAPDEKAIRTITEYLEDGQKIANTPLYGPNGTFNGFDHDKVLDHRIDYIFVKNLSVEKYTHIDDRLENLKYISDHLPVLITVFQN